MISQEKISHIDFHENSDKIRTIESLRNLLIVEYNNYLETLDIRTSLSQSYETHSVSYYL